MNAFKIHLHDFWSNDEIHLIVRKYYTANASTLDQSKTFWWFRLCCRRPYCSFIKSVSWWFHLDSDTVTALTSWLPFLSIMGKYNLAARQRLDFTMGILLKSCLERGSVDFTGVWIIEKETPKFSCLYYQACHFEREILLALFSTLQWVYQLNWIPSMQADNTLVRSRLFAPASLFVFLSLLDTLHLRRLHALGATTGVHCLTISRLGISILKRMCNLIEKDIHFGLFFQAPFVLIQTPTVLLW